MLRYRHIWPLVRQLPPEFAHSLALAFLRLPIRIADAPVDPFTWGGLAFRNRVGVAAGFDKNAECVLGVERMGAGFVEVGTVLISPWKGNSARPRMSRLLDIHGIWNRLGFTSRGMARVARNLAAVPRDRRGGLVVASNVGPHPGNLRVCTNREQSFATVERELFFVCSTLYPNSDAFVINLSSPNTPGLRSLLHAPELVDVVVRPIRDSLRKWDADTSRSWTTPLLIKLPPEDENRELWTESSLNGLIGPLLAADACDGFVAVNTSTRLALKHVHGISHPELPGGVSGDPLRQEALRIVRMLRPLIGPQRLLIACGGVMEPAHAREFREAGADLVEVYSGMIYAGPGLVAKSATACITPQ